MEWTTHLNSAHSAAAWELNAPYTKMLHSYQSAAGRIQDRISELKNIRKAIQLCKCASTASSNEQKILDERIRLLYREYVELAESIRQIRIYAMREAQ